MWLPMTERAAWLPRKGAPQGLWLGPDGLWDYGPMPGWRTPAGTSAPPVHYAGFDAWCQRHPGRACGLIVSSWWLHEVVLDRSLPLADDTARLSYARNLLQHYHGDAALQWPLAAWQAAGRRGISALHAVRLSDWQASARQCGVALRSVRPWWSLALAMAQQQARTLGQAEAARLLVVDGALVTQVDFVRGTLEGLLHRRLARADGAELQPLVEQAPQGGCHALGHGLPTDTSLPPGLIRLGSMVGASPATLWLPAGPRQQLAA